ncbi:MAG: hypothetical protein WAZ60_23850 [Desulfosalsimonadaceae bacterium]
MEKFWMVWNENGGAPTCQHRSPTSAEEIAKEATLASKTPESERTPEQKAIIKADADMDFAFQHGWVDFDDDPEEYRS